MIVLLQILLLLACIQNSYDGRKQNIDNESKFDDGQFKYGHTVKIKRNEILHNARVTADSKVPAIHHYQMTYQSNTYYKVKKKIKDISKKSRDKSNMESFAFSICTVFLTAVLIHEMLICNTNGKVSILFRFFRYIIMNSHVGRFRKNIMLCIFTQGFHI